MREHLIAFIKAAAARQDGTSGEPGRTRNQFSLNAGDGSPSLEFGYGYFDRSGVLYYDETGEPVVGLTVEEGVDRWLKAYGLSEV